MRKLAVVASLVAVAATPTPTPTRAPPVFVVYRNPAASYVDPSRTNPIFVLVIGSDIREGDPATGRADSLHIVAANSATGRGTVLGIPRDIYVPVAGAGMRKIGESLYYGGTERTVETVGRMTGIPIHYWAIVDFARFRTLVDRLGGVDVTVPYAMRDAFSGAFFDPGPRHMNGAEALAFSRNRHGPPGGDVGRSENQGRLLLAALTKFRAEAAEPLGLFRYLETFKELVISNLPLSDWIVLGNLARRFDASAFANVVVPAHAGTAGAASILLLDPGAPGLFAAIRDDGML